jgi:hypothetical protein
MVTSLPGTDAGSYRLMLQGCWRSDSNFNSMVVAKNGPKLETVEAARNLRH